MDQTSSNSSTIGSSGVAAASKPEYTELISETHLIETQTGGALTTSTVAERGSSVVIAPSNAMRSLGDDLRDFFARPRPIYTYNWQNAVTACIYIAPWALLFNNLSVIEKMRYYSLFRGTLHVLGLTSTQPQYAGGLRVHYQPWGTIVSQMRGKDVGSTVANPSYISASASTGVHFKCPFFYDQAWLQIGMAGGAPSLVLTEATLLGEIGILPVTPLTKADGTAAGTIDVQFYAWFEDVQLAAPTYNVQSSITKGGANEAVRGGAISAPATAISRFAGTLQDIPVIGPFAKATSIAAGAIASVASIFGFSKPATIRDQDVNIVRAYGKTSTVFGLDSAEKLSSDPKQECPISPEWVGLPPSEMSTYLALAQQEGALGYFSINTSDAPGAFVANYQVHPYQYNADLVTPTLLNPLPCAWAALPFINWRGSMIFRFRVFSSPFQRGRLFVFYEPSFGSKATTAAFNTLTADALLDTNRFCILDISSETDVDFVVKWNQPFEWGKNYGLVPAPTQVGGTYSNQTNGMIGIFIDAPLTSPGATQCSVFVTLRAGDDFEVADPTLLQLAAYQTQALVTKGGVGNADQAPVTCILADGGESPNAAFVYFGEKVLSMRAMAKRYSMFFSWNAPTDATAHTAGNYFILQLSSLLPSRGVVAGPSRSRFQWTWGAHWAAVHATVRGGARFKITHNIPPSVRAMFIISRNAGGPTRSSPWFASSIGFTDVGRSSFTDPYSTTGNFFTSTFHTWGDSGYQIIDAHSPGGCEYEVPSSGVNLQYPSIWTPNGPFQAMPFHYVHVIIQDYDPRKVLLQFHGAAAEDYTPMFYVGPPQVKAVALPDAGVAAWVT